LHERTATYLPGAYIILKKGDTIDWVIEQSLLWYCNADAFIGWWAERKVAQKLAAMSWVKQVEGASRVVEGADLVVTTEDDRRYTVGVKCNSGSFFEGKNTPVNWRASAGQQPDLEVLILQDSGLIHALPCTGLAGGADQNVMMNLGTTTSLQEQDDQFAVNIEYALGGQNILALPSASCARTMALSLPVLKRALVTIDRGAKGTALAEAMLGPPLHLGSVTQENAGDPFEFSCSPTADTDQWKAALHAVAPSPPAGDGAPSYQWPTLLSNSAPEGSSGSSSSGLWAKLAPKKPLLKKPKKEHGSSQQRRGRGVQRREYELSKRSRKKSKEVQKTRLPKGVFKLNSNRGGRLADWLQSARQHRGPGQARAPTGAREEAAKLAGERKLASALDAAVTQQQEWSTNSSSQSRFCAGALENGGLCAFSDVHGRKRLVLHMQQAPGSCARHHASGKPHPLHATAALVQKQEAEEADFVRTENAFELAERRAAASRAAAADLVASGPVATARGRIHAAAAMGLAAAAPAHPVGAPPAGSSSRRPVRLAAANNTAVHANRDTRANAAAKPAQSKRQCDGGAGAPGEGGSPKRQRTAASLLCADAVVVPVSTPPQPVVAAQAPALSLQEQHEVSAQAVAEASAAGQVLRSLAFTWSEAGTPRDVEMEEEC
jgi:hypothetical protein